MTPILSCSCLYQQTIGATELLHKKESAKLTKIILFHEKHYCSCSLWFHNNARYLLRKNSASWINLQLQLPNSQTLVFLISFWANCILGNSPPFFSRKSNILSWHKYFYTNAVFDVKNFVNGGVVEKHVVKTVWSNNFIASSIIKNT